MSFLTQLFSRNWKRRRKPLSHRTLFPVMQLFRKRPVMPQFLMFLFHLMPLLGPQPFLKPLSHRSLFPLRLVFLMFRFQVISRSR